MTGEEFETLMEVLSRLNYITTEEGSQQVAALISDQAELNTDFQVSLSPPPSFPLSLSLSLFLSFSLFSSLSVCMCECSLSFVMLWYCDHVTVM